MKTSLPRALLLAALLGLGPGCGFREVRFNITEAPKVKLPGVRTVAILGFADPYHQQAYGAAFAAQLAEAFGEHGGFTLVPSETVGRVLAPLRLQPSEIASAAVIREVGERLGADALLYGDLLEASVAPRVETTRETRQVGEQPVVAEERQPDGSMRRVTRMIPVYHDFWRRKRIRAARLRAEGRLVRAADNAVLWSGSVERAKEAESWETEEGARGGDWSPDADLLARLTRRAANRLARDLFPRVLTRVRRLAEPGDESAYARLVAEGNEYAQAGQWELAGGSWLRAAALAPERPEARANLGVLRERAGDFVQAAADYATAADRLGSPWREYAREAEQTRE